MDAKEVEVIDLQAELQVFDPVAFAIEEAKKKNADLVFDYEDKDGNKAARSHIAELRRLKAPINEVHKVAKAEALKFTKALDSKKKELIGAVEDMIKVHHEPIWEIEQRELAIQAEKELEAKRKEEEAEIARLAEIEKRELELAEREAQVQAEKDKLGREARERQVAEDAKKQAREDARQAVIDAENAKIAAEERVKQDAINAENARKQALVDAENAKAAAVQRAKDEAAAEAAALSAHVADLEVKETALAEEAEAAEQLRIADTEHRSKIHRAIYSALIDMQCDKAAATWFTQLLIDEKIPHTHIQY